MPVFPLPLQEGFYSFYFNLTCECMLSHFSCTRLLVTLWTVGHQAPLSMGFSRQEYWSKLKCSPPEDLPDPAIEPASPISCTGRRVLYY